MKVFLDGNFHLKKGNQYIDDDERYNRYRELWNELPKKHIVRYFPIHLDIELNSNCNLKCVQCFQSFDPPEPKFMDFEIVKKIIDEGAQKDLCSIKFQYRGEPLLYPRLADAIKYAKDNDVIETMFNTNGMLLTEKKSKELIEAGLDKIIFSIDDHRPDVYKKTRLGGDLNVVINNIKTLQALKKAKNLNKPIVRIQKINFPETQEFNGVYIELFNEIADHIAVHDLLDYRCQPTWKEFPSWCCAQLWQRILILVDGSIVACTGLNSKISRLGHISVNTIEELWKGPKMTNFRELHMKGNSHKMRACRACPLRLNYIDKA